MITVFVDGKALGTLAGLKSDPGITEKEDLIIEFIKE